MIPRFVRTLRFKLTFFNTIVFAALIAVTCVLFLNLQRHGMTAALDERLNTRADTIIEVFKAEEDLGLGIGRAPSWRPSIDPTRFPSFYIQFRSESGRNIIFRSKTLQAVTKTPAPIAPIPTTLSATSSPHDAGVADPSNSGLEDASGKPPAAVSSALRDESPTTQPAPPPVRLHYELPLSGAAAALRGHMDRHIETIVGENVNAFVPDGHGLRLLTLYINPKGLEDPEQRKCVPFFIQVALPMYGIETSMDGLRKNFLIVAPIVLLVSGFASWLLARRSLSPIGRIAREARELTALRLDRRIAVPEGHDEVVDMTQTINEMLDRLEAAFRAQERFIADAAHELKTPVATALSGTQVLLQKARSMEEYEEFVASLQDELRRIGQMVDSLLTLARADAGLSPGTASPVPINEIVMSAVQSCQPIAVQREVRLVPKLAMPGSNSPELVVVGDDDLLHSMISNLIRNAIRHAPVDSPVEVEVSAHSGEAHITVRDSGPGIDPPYLDRIFDRFFQVPSDQHRLKGSGLGLAIAKGVARLHGGDISVANRPSGGCEFVIRLPIKTR